MHKSGSEGQSAARANAESGALRSMGGAAVLGVLWITAGRLVKSPMNLIVVAILARLLTPAEFGIVAIAHVVLGLSNLLIDGTFGMVLIQRREVTPALVGASLLLSFTLGIVFAAALFAAAPLVESFFGFPQLGPVVRVLSLILPISAAAAIWTALLQRASMFKTLTVNSAAAQLIYGIVAVALALMGMGVWALVWAQVAGISGEALLGYVAGRRRYHVAFSPTAVADVLRSGGMFTLSKLFNWAAWHIDRIVVGRMLGPTALGLYSRATSLMATANQVIGAGSFRVLFSTFSRFQDDRPRMLRAFDRTLSAYMIGSAFLSAFVVLFADIIVRILLGPQWTSSVPLIQTLFAAFASRSGYAVAEAVPVSLGLARASAIRQLIHCLLVLAGAAVGALYGTVGAAIGVAVAYWLFYLISLMLVRQLLNAGIGRLAVIHLNALILIALPVAAALSAEFVLQPARNLLLELVPAGIFGIASAGILALAPERLLAEDMAKARSKLFERAFWAPRP